MPDIRSNEKKYKVPFFRRFMLFYTVIFSVTLCFGVSVLYDWLDAYEKSRPVYAIESFMTGVTDSFYRSTIESGITVSTLEFEKEEDVQGMADGFLNAGHTYSYKKKSDEYSDNNPVYLIMADDAVFMKVTFKAEEKRDKYGFPKWKLAAEEPMVDFNFEPSYSVRALLPDYASLKINGITADEKYITDDSRPVPELEAISDFLDVMPHMKEYTINGLYCRPSVEAFATTGTGLDYTVDDDGVYCFEFEKSEALEKEHSAYIIDMERAYISFMINENLAANGNFPKLGKYILSEAPIYRQISGCSISSNNPFERREDKLISAENFRFYSDECFSCDMVFNVKLIQHSFTKEFTGNLRWYFVCRDGKWLAANMTLIK